MQIFDLNAFLRKTPLQTAISIVFWVGMLGMAWTSTSLFFGFLFAFAALTDMASFAFEALMYSRPERFPVKKYLKPSLYVSIVSKVIFILCLGFGFGMDLDLLSIVIILFMAVGIRMEADVVANIDAYIQPGKPQNPDQP